MQKTILITGATDGLGLAAAQRLSGMGHRVLLHGRNPEKLEAAAGMMRGPSATFAADMSRLSDVEILAEALAPERPDVLINNAGVFKTPHPVTAEGLDVRFVVNTLAPFLLTRRLLVGLPPDGRVVNVSSAAQAPVDIRALTGERRLADMEAYAQSKLALVVWTRALAARHPKGPHFYAVNPGSLLASKMVRDGFGVAGKDIGIGADILARAALSEAFGGRSGAYFDNDSGQFAQPHPSALDASAAQAVMAAMEALLPSG